MGRVTAQIRPQVQGMAGGGEEAQVGPVGVVRQKRRFMGMAHLRQGGDVRQVSQVIRAGDIDGGGGGRQDLQRPFQPLRRNGAGAEGGPRSLLRPEPEGFEVQQGGGMDKGFVDVPGRQDYRGRPRRAVLEGQEQHGLDTLAGAPGGIERGPGAKEGGGVFLALRDDARRLIEGIRPGDFR